MPRSLVIGNWKMNGSRAANDRLLTALIELSTRVSKAKLALCAPSLYVQQLSERLVDCSIAYGAQDVSTHANGAYTGEVSSSMLADFSCAYVIVGHSERRQYHQESDLLVAQKALAALQGNVTPVICVGETLEQRESQDTLSVIKRQLDAIQTVLDNDSLSKTVIAYEPVWAIGTGLTATPEQAQDVHQFIRGQLGAVSEQVSILYGGSVKPDNAAELFKKADIDGALVGGASLDAEAFIDIACAF